MCAFNCKLARELYRMAKCMASIILLAGLTLLKGIPVEILAAVSFLLRK